MTESYLVLDRVAIVTLVAWALLMIGAFVLVVLSARETIRDACYVLGSTDQSETPVSPLVWEDQR